MPHKKLAIIFFILPVLFLTACTNKPEPVIEKPVVEPNETTKIEETKKEYQGELSDEKDLKKYKNDYYGITFEYDDQDGKIILGDQAENFISLYQKLEEGRKYIASESKDIYLYFKYYENFYEGEKYESIGEYIKIGGNKLYESKTEILSTDKTINDFGTEYYTVKAKGTRTQVPGTHDGTATQEVISYRYYIKIDCLKDIDYVQISCKNLDQTCQEILSSFQVLKIKQ